MTMAKRLEVQQNKKNQKVEENVRQNAERQTLHTAQLTNTQRSMLMQSRVRNTVKSEKPVGNSTLAGLLRERDVERMPTFDPAGDAPDWEDDPEEIPDEPLPET